MQATVQPHTDHWFCDAVCSALPELYGRARRLTRSAADAEDLVAEAVAKAWEHHETLRDRAQFRAWIFRILHNVHISQRRSQYAQASHQSLDDDADTAALEFSLFEHLHQPFLLWWSNPEQEFLNKVLREDLEHAVDALPDVFRIVVVLCDVEGWPYRDIAAALEIPVGTVKSRLARGRSMLQQTLWRQARDIGLRTHDNDNPNGAAQS